MRKIIISIAIAAIAISAHAVQNTIRDQVECAALGLPRNTDLCTYFYNALVNDQNRASNYNNLSSQAKTNLNYAMNNHLSQCINRCGGDEFTYCNYVSKQVEAAAKKRLEEQNSITHKIKNFF